MKYQVIFRKEEIYEVEAENSFEAEDKAFELMQNDFLAWLDDDLMTSYVFELKDKEEEEEE